MARSKTVTLFNEAATGTDVTQALQTSFSVSVSFQVTKTGTLASTTVFIQKSLDGTNWANVGSAATLTAGTNPQTVELTATNASAPFHRLSCPTTGSGNLTIIGFLRDNG
jgi:hypothetical protein